MNPKTDTPLTMNSWRITATTLLRTVDRLCEAWNHRLPVRNSLPTAEEDLMCDEWCWKLAEDLNGAIEPPKEIQRWVLARLLAMAEKATELHKAGMSGAPALTELTLRMFLITEWHKRLRKVWKRDVPPNTLAAAA